MARANYPNSLQFGFAAIGLYRANGELAGASEIVGSFSADVTPALVMTEGGAAQLPIAARGARATGEGTITLRERPNWIDTELNRGTTSTTTASATATASAVSAIQGTSLNSISITAGTTALDDMRFTVEATAAAVVTVNVVGTGGAQIFENVTLSNTAVAIGQTGVSITGGSSPNYTVGDKVTFDVAPPHGGITEIVVPQVRDTLQYQVRLYSQRGGSDDALTVYTFPSVVISGVNAMLTDIESPEVELPIRVLAPEGGGGFMTVRKINKA